MFLDIDRHMAGLRADVQEPEYLVTGDLLCADDTMLLSRMKTSVTAWN